ncbi:MAG TPA: hypothetical protein VNB24_03865 [Acidimicrobiales bacterium]|nr:hypothetical protein [Acidimicrobiales bacterium]
MMRASFLLVMFGTLLSFATGSWFGPVAIDSVGVAIVVLGCIGVLSSLATAALADETVATATVTVTSTESAI